MEEEILIIKIILYEGEVFLFFLLCIVVWNKIRYE